MENFYETFTFYVPEGSTSIDIDESPSNHGNKKQGKKVSRNGVGNGDQGRSRMEAPKEGDQLKLSELFNVLRVKKPEEKVVQETQVRRISSRKYSESDSDSSSNSDIDIRSNSTAPSVTESELDGRRIESPRGLDSPRSLGSPAPRIVEPPVVAAVSRPAERYSLVKNVESPEYRTENESNRPKPSPRSPKAAARRKVKSENLDHENITPVSRPRPKERRSGGTEHVFESQAAMSRSMEIKSSRRSAEGIEQSDNGSIHSELNLHVAKTRESLDKKSRSQASLDSRQLDSSSAARPKTKEQILRKSADNISLESKQVINADQRSLNKSDNQLDRTNGAELENKRRANKTDVKVKSSSSNREPILVEKSQNVAKQVDIEIFDERDIQLEHSKDNEQLISSKDDEGHTQRSGSPYSFSMDSLPSSHPSPTFNRCSFSSNPDSDTDSLSRLKSRPDVILEQSPSSSTVSAKSKSDVDDKEDVVVEQISKVQFRRISKTVGQLGAMAKMSLSPNRNNSTEIDRVIEQRETQGRVGSGLREEGGGSNKVKTVQTTQDMDDVFEDSSSFEEIVVKEDPCIKQDISDKVPSPKLVTDLLMKKLEVMSGNERNNLSARTRSVEEMTWINMDVNSNSQIEGFENKPFKRLPKLMTSSVASDFDRKASEADSIEEMIDDMARGARLFVSTNAPARPSEADSDIGFSLTPISPFPQEVYEKRSGKYNRFAYISDDNLEGDSADDMINDEEHIDSVDKIIEKENDKHVPAKEITSLKKKEIKSMDSLDLLLNEQGDLVDGSQEVIELEKEYLDALKFTEESNCTNCKRPEGDNLNVNEDSNNNEERLKIKAEIDNLTSKIASDFGNQTELTDELGNGNIELHPDVIKANDPAISKPLKTKAKLETQSTLDILLDQQGDFVDQSTDNIEIDSDLLANLEQNFKEHLLVQKSSPTLSKEYAYLGFQHEVVQKSRENQHGTSSPSQDDFESLVEGAKDYLDGRKTKEVVPVADSLSKVRKIMHHDLSPESSDSDMLSVIEEVEDEISGSDDDLKGDFKNKYELQKSMQNFGKPTKIEICSNEKEKGCKDESSEKSIGKKSESRDGKEETENVNKPQTKGKIFQKARDIEQRMKNLVRGGGSSSAITSKRDEVKRDKYKKVHDHWLALEKHEADMLDIDMDEFDKDKDEGNIPAKMEGVNTVLVTEIMKREVKDESTAVSGNPDISDTDIETEIDDKAGILKVESDIIKEQFESELLAEVKCEAVSNVLSGQLNNVKNESTDLPNSKNVKVIDEEELTEQIILNSTVIDKKGTSINDSNVFCHTISDISSLADIEAQDNIYINKHVNEINDHNGASINDSNVFCHTLSDINTLTDSGALDSSLTNKQTDTDLANQNQFSALARNSCHSLPEEDVEQIQDIVKENKQTVPRTSINDSRGSCQSISELHDPILENLSHESSSLCLNSQGGITVDNSQDEVFDDKQLADTTGQENINKERLSSEEIRCEIKIMQQSQKRYTTEIELNVDMSGKITPPAISKDPEFFKPPEKPPRSKRTSSSSDPNSPEITPAIPQVYVDSPRAEKLSSARDSPRDSPRTVSECSISQDDSGNVSGGSRGTTPEHRRTDSSYSQSSIPSTLSNVTDEDEDIDNIVARVQKQNRSNLLSVFGDSRESLASYYSDAGDIAYSNIPVTGEILFSLNYNYKTNMLEVGVKQCRNIAVADARRRRSDPYVKTYLLPDRTRGGKRKTKVKKHSTSPTFDETLKYSLTKSELENRTLWLTVWHNDRFGRNVFLGEVTINFDYYKFEDPFPRWYPLQERMDAPPPSMMVYKGDLSLCIKFVPAEKLGASTSGKQKKDSGKGQLQVMVKEARNLTAVKSNGFSDPFCKGYLLPERHKSSKQKTAVVKKDCNPVWNHTFIFEDVTLMELRERCLELTIWDYEKLSSNDFLGGVRLNLGTGVSGGKQVDWMDARGEEMSMWQAMLDRANFWIDGALILRPNMDKRKY